MPINFEMRSIAKDDWFRKIVLVLLAFRHPIRKFSTLPMVCWLLLTVATCTRAYADLWWVFDVEWFSRYRTTPERRWIEMFRFLGSLLRTAVVLSINRMIRRRTTTFLFTVELVSPNFLINLWIVDRFGTFRRQKIPRSLRIVSAYRSPHLQCVFTTIMYNNDKWKM